MRVDSRILLGLLCQRHMLVRLSQVQLGELFPACKSGNEIFGLRKGVLIYFYTEDDGHFVVTTQV